MIGIFRDTPAAPRSATKSQPPLNRQSILEQVERTVASPLFRNSKRYAGLLRYAVEQKLEGRTHLLKERLIGIEVFGRRLDYSPKFDPIVRTEARRLRTRLNEFYAETGIGDPLVIDLPKGGYVPVVRLASQPPQSAASSQPQARR